jgi:hypothetical protein
MERSYVVKKNGWNKSGDDRHHFMIDAVREVIKIVMCSSYQNSIETFNHEDGYKMSERN